MSRLTRRVAIRPKSLAKTYADFVAHITTRATAGSRLWGQTFALSGGEMSRFTTQAGAITGTMHGSTWFSPPSTGYAWANSSVCRAIQHAMPSEAAFLDQIANGRLIYYQHSQATDAWCQALNRNGYLSDGGSTVPGSSSILELIYWDGAQAMRMQPSLGLGPEPYTWP